MPPHSEPLLQAHHRLSVATRGPGFYDITRDVQTWLTREAVDDGLVTLFIRHTSASLAIQENADPDVLADLGDALAHLAPESRSYRHAMEGPDDMPAHIKGLLTATSLQIPVLDGRIALGTWQGIYVIEHRRQAHERSVALIYQGTFSTPPASRAGR